MESVDVASFLSRLNGIRGPHSSPPLSWSPELARSASEWAAKHKFEHSKRPDVSENLFLSTKLDKALGEALGSWYAEEKTYSYRDPGFSPATGHATALLWKASTRVGAAISRMPNGFYLYVVQFSPRGNFGTARSYAANVAPKAS
jgi:uncharacterized protein YkwD